MTEIAKIISGWPVIIQGALGSALFWISLKTLNWLLRVIAVIWSKLSQNARREKKRAELIFHKQIRGQDPIGYLHCIYRALGYLSQALAWTISGMMFSGYLEVFYIVGLFGGLIYVFKAMRWIVPPYKIHDTEEGRWRKIKELETELNGEASKETNAILSRIGSTVDKRN